MLISKFDTTDITDKINEFESKYNITLPERYRVFMLKYNGGRTPKTKFKKGRSSSDVRAFYGFGDVMYSFEEIVDLDEWVKKDILPIACDSFGNKISIGLNGDSVNKIYFCDHEKGFKKALIANDLQDFTDKCKSEKCKPVMSIEERRRLMIEEGREHIISDGLIQIWQDEIDLYGNIVQEKVMF